MADRFVHTTVAQRGIEFMSKLDVTHTISMKKAITSIELADITQNGKDELVVTMLDGSIQICEFQKNPKAPLKLICKSTNIPPVSALGIGDVTGNGTPDFIVGSIENTLLTVSFEKGKLMVKNSVALGHPPTAICVLNVVDTPSKEVVVATSDNALRCYGWFDTGLDKLAHKVVEHPIFSIVPLHTEGMPYAHFIFGDDSGYVYLYQYQDDRLHERSKIKVTGEVNLVSTGRISGDKTDDIIAISDGSVLNLLHLVHNKIEMIDRLRAPGPVTSVKIAPVGKTSGSQIISSQGNSKITLLSFHNNRMYENLSIRTAKKSVESLVACGDIYGDGETHIVQAISKKLNVISLID